VVAGYKRVRSTTITRGPAYLARAPRSAGRVSSSVQLSEMTYGLGVACATDGSCVVVGYSGDDGKVVRVEASNSVGTTATVPGVRLADLACIPGDGPCWGIGTATDGRAAIVPIQRDGTVGAAQRIDGTTWGHAIDCTASSTCFAVAGNVSQPLILTIPADGSVVVRGVQPAASTLVRGISCVEGTLSCVAVGEKRGAYRSNDRAIALPVVEGVPGTPVSVGNLRGLSDVDCPARTRCFASAEVHDLRDPVIQDSDENVTSGDDLVGGVATLNVTGIELVDTTPPSVRVEQAVGQPDPTVDPVARFTASFSEPVTGLEPGDVVVEGPTGGVVTAVDPAGDNTFAITVSDMTAAGDVTVSLPAGAAQDGANLDSTASISTDNTVTYTPAAPPNEPPTAVAVQATTVQDQPVTITLQGSDPEDQSLTYQVVEPPTHGTLGAIAPSGAVQYTPPPGYIGPDTFTYRVSDGLAWSAPATAFIEVTEPPPSPLEQLCTALGPLGLLPLFQLFGLCP
jgi:hypothetical protein